MEGQPSTKIHRTSGLTIFVAALLVSDFRLAIALVGQKLFYANPPSSFSDALFALQQFLLFELVPFMVSPVLLFYIFYRLGKSVALAERYRSVAGLLFAGGVAGYASSFFFLSIVFGSTWSYAFPNLSSVVTTIANLAFAFAAHGLSTLFAGFVAITVANFRLREGQRKMPADPNP